MGLSYKQEIALTH